MADPSLPWPDARAQRRMLIVLSIVVMFTVLDRQVLALMIEPLQQDFDVSDTQAALLLGAAFSLTYALAGLPIARIADAWNRRNLVAMSLAFWSAATMACGVAQNYMQMFLARMAIGMGESGYGPAAWSMVTDTFPRHRIAFASSILSVGAVVGTGLALLLGGVALALVSHLPPVDVPLLGTIRNWQWAFLIVGFPGLLWALVVMMLREPARRGIASTVRMTAVPVREVARYILHDWRSYFAVIGGTTMKYLITVGALQWMPTLLRREFDWQLDRIGVTLGCVTLVAAPLGLVSGGALAQRWAMQGRPDADVRMLLYSLMAAVPLYAAMPLLPAPALVVGAYAMALFIAALGTGPAVAAFLVITPNSMRAQVSSLSQFCINVLAFAIGPLIVALFTDFLFQDPADLKYSMSLSVAILGPLAILSVWQGLKPYARSHERTAREFAG